MAEWLGSLSGVWGPPLLKFYVENSVWINTTVVLYGLFLLLSWQNLNKMREHLRNEVAQQIEKHNGKIEQNSLRISWKQALCISRFPFIAVEKGFIPRRTTYENLQLLVPIEDLLPKTKTSLPKISIRRKPRVK